jgi:hypothetical protein
VSVACANAQIPRSNDRARRLLAPLSSAAGRVRRPGPGMGNSKIAFDTADQWNVGTPPCSNARHKSSGDHMQSWLSQSAALLSVISATAAAALLPVALTIFSKRSIVVLGFAVLALVSVCILVAPFNTAEVAAFGFYSACLVIAVSVIVARQKGRGLQNEINRLWRETARLRQHLDALSLAEQRRFLQELKEQERISIVPDASSQAGRARPDMRNYAGPRDTAPDQRTPRGARG